jgi:hypothetical protein
MNLEREEILARIAALASYLLLPPQPSTGEQVKATRKLREYLEMLDEGRIDLNVLEAALR